MSRRATFGTREPWRRQLRFPREGLYFIAVTMGVGIAAINTGNNLLFLMLGLLLSLILLSGVLSESALRNVEVRRRLPCRAFAGSPFLVEVVLQNHKRRAPTYSVEIEDVVEGRPADKRCYFLKVSPDASQTAAYQLTLPARGRHRFLGFRAGTRFPFGLFEKWREMKGQEEMVVFPALAPLSAAARAGPPGDGDDPSRRRGRGPETLGLRDYRAGDDSRDIHWTTSARAGRLILREREDPGARSIVLRLDNALARDAGADERARFERDVSVAASLAQDAVGRGVAVRVVTRGAASAEARDARSLDVVLRFLALLDPVELSTARSFPDAGERAARDVRDVASAARET